MTLHILPYRLAWDASLCATRSVIEPLMSTVMKPCSALSRFLREIDTR
jgi:hypothetical protein